MDQIFCDVTTAHMRPPRPALPSFRAELALSEVFRILLQHKNSIHIDFLQPELFSQG